MARADRGPGLSAPGRPTRANIGGDDDLQPQQADARENRRPRATKTTASGVTYVDYKDTETLRRLMSNNGKMNTRRRNQASAMEQRMISTAIKRARIMGLLPFVETSS